MVGQEDSSLQYFGMCLKCQFLFFDMSDTYCPENPVCWQNCHCGANLFGNSYCYSCSCYCDSEKESSSYGEWDNSNCNVPDCTHELTAVFIFSDTIAHICCVDCNMILD